MRGQVTGRAWHKRRLPGHFMANVTSSALSFFDNRAEGMSGPSLLGVICRGSKKRIPGVMYNIDRPALVPSMAWRGSVEEAGTSARLGLAIRTLDTQIPWEGLKRPAADSSAPFASLELSSKRQAASGRGSEYLVHQPEEVGWRDQPK